MAKNGLAKKAARAKVVLELIEKFTAERKGLYEEVEGLIADLAGVPAPELAAHGLRVTDSFAKGNTQWGHGPVRRFTLETVEAPDPVAAAPAKTTSSEGARKRKPS